MSDFKPGDKVLLPRGAGVVGTVCQPIQAGVEGVYFIETPSGATRFANPDQLTPLPSDTPLYGMGDSVQVTDDATHHAGRTGAVNGPKIYGTTFGYFIDFGTPGDLAWVPAAALTTTTARVATTREQT